jgi:hypothetical protein
MDTYTARIARKTSAAIGYSVLVIALLFCTNAKAAPQLSPSSTAVASFVGADAVSQGNWQGQYGADGYSIANGSQVLPSYASFAPLNQSNWTWTSNTADPRALQTIPAGRTAATWYSSSTFSLDVNLTDGKSHPIAIYALDWDAYMGGRAETIQVVDANSNAVLDTRNISSFTGGIYLGWNVTGHVRINATMNSGGNSVVSGIFFGGAALIPPVAGQVAPSITTQPVGQSVTVGQSATFLVGDAGTAPLTCQWKKNGVAISGATSSSYTTLGTASSDNGSQFSVVVTNGAGAVASSSAVLTVNTPTLILNTSATALSFGSVNLSNSSVQTVTLTNVGTGNVVISSVSISGAGFNASGVSSGTILAPGQSAILSATFTPAASGSVTGAVSVGSNATSGAKVIALSGAGTAPIAHSVTLSWSPSTSTVVGYNVYVSTVSGSSYAKLSGSLAVTPSYVDAGLETAQTRYYVVTSVDSNNNESGFSNQVAAIVP